MRTSPRRGVLRFWQGAAVLLLALGLGVVAAASLAFRFGATDATFTKSRNAGANAFATKPDWTPPVTSAAVVANSLGNAGYLKQGGTYQVCANVSDSGNPASGVSTVRGNLAVASNVVTTGLTSVTIASGSVTCAGTSYGYSTSTQTADGSISEGSKTYSVTSTDAAGNAATTNWTVTIDNTAPTTSAAVLLNAAGFTGALKQGGTYKVCANVTDSGSIPSGVGTVTGNMSVPPGANKITNGLTAAALAAGSVSCGGTTYGFATVTETADSSIAEGSKTFTVTSTDAAGNSATTTWTAILDNTAPTNSAAVVLNSLGYAGFLKQGGTYQVCASATDSGSPASGIGSVAANMAVASNVVTTGLTALTASSGSFTCNGVSYSYQSASQTADGAISEGSKTFSLTSTDSAGNATTTNYTVTIDNTAPTASAAVVLNSIGKTGALKQGDTYQVCANDSDGGAVPSGINTVTGNLAVASNVVTTGLAAVSLSSGSYTCSGTSYGYQTATQTADASISEGTKTFSVTSTDKANNAATANFTVTIDNTAPTASATVVLNSIGKTGALKQGDTYQVCANDSDGGAVPTGINTVTGNLAVASNVVTTGLTAVTLSSGSYTCNGASYGFQTATQTANASITEGTKTFSVTSTDKANNAATANFTVTIDNTAPTASAAAVLNSSGKTGALKQGDTYQVCANDSDGGAVPSGINTVTGNLAVASNVVTTGLTAATLSSGSYTCNGTSYGYQTATQTANASITEGSKTFSLSSTDVAGNAATANFTVTIDNTAPTASAGVVLNSIGYSGTLKQGDTYQVCANGSDGGAVPSGIGTVTGNMAVASNVITTGLTAVTLSSGSYTCNGTSYGYQTSAQTANGSITEGSKTFSLASTDVAGNAATGNFTVTVDNTAPTSSSFASANKVGGTAGLIEQGDSFTLGVSESGIDLDRIVSGWTGSSQAIFVKVVSNGFGSNQDGLWVCKANTANCAGGTSADNILGTINLNNKDYVTSSGPAVFNATIAFSSTTFTVTIGSCVSGCAAVNTGGSSTATFTPISGSSAGGIRDKAGNNMSASSTRTETGPHF